MGCCAFSGRTDIAAGFERAKRGEMCIFRKNMNIFFNHENNTDGVQQFKNKLSPDGLIALDCFFMIKIIDWSNVGRARPISHNGYYMSA